MSDVVIRAEKLGKLYRIGEDGRGAFRYKSLRDVLSNPFRHKPSANGDTIWALKDVSFEVKQGEVVGIIGRNGAGKSTLLKILSRITEPTEGYAEIRGRVGSLLEVGTGFHPELTGRENIFLNGAILGMKKAEIARKFDEIVAFAEVEKFIDTPVKHYSSGMYVRLAFAVAAHLEPEILLVDEVLAVGDAAFQKKCLGKMGDVAKQGRTVVLVSHNMQAIRTLCRSAVLLSDGRKELDGNADQVVDLYLTAHLTDVWCRSWDDLQSAPGDHAIRLLEASLVPEAGAEKQVLTIKTPFRLEFTFHLGLPEAMIYTGIHVRNAYGECIFVTASTAKRIRQGSHRSVCSIPGNLLNNGTYSIHLYLVRDGNVVLLEMPEALVFEVHDAGRDPDGFLGDLPGAVRPKLHWEMNTLEAGHWHTTPPARHPYTSE